MGSVYGQPRSYKGGIIQSDTTRRQITLLFTCADYADGATEILSTLKEEDITAAFFVTGSFIRKYPEILKQIIKSGHYVGSHSYSHPLYAPWDKSDNTIISHAEFDADIRESYQALKPFGITRRKARWFMPPYEHYNDTISKWTRQLGLQLVNYTPGTTSNADYTTPEMKNYRSSETILQNILRYEDQHTLCGHLMLFHIGTVPERTDKFWHICLPQMIKELRQRGYKFISLQKALRKTKMHN